jgi:pimeloyl-ACP methyl ester carboxylesterase
VQNVSKGKRKKRWVILEREGSNIKPMDILNELGSKNLLERDLVDEEWLAPLQNWLEIGVEEFEFTSFTTNRIIQNINSKAGETPTPQEIWSKYNELSPSISSENVEEINSDSNNAEIELDNGNSTSQPINNSTDIPQPIIYNNSVVGNNSEGINDEINQSQLGFDIEAKGIVTGGLTSGTLLPGVDPINRNINFNLFSTGGLDRNQLKQSWTPTQTWVIIHGWNNSSENFFNLTDVVSKAQPNDVVLTLDWREAANTGSNLFAGDNGKAATWIGPVADFAFQKLTDWGLETGSSVNFIGHSLGSLLSSEIATRFGEVNTITALDPPSELNLIGGYDIDGRLPGINRPKRFDSVSNFSRSFVGRRSVAGNQEFASWADESIQMDFGFRFDTGQEHGWVIDTFTKLINPDQNQLKLANNLFTLNANGRYPEFRTNAFEQRHEGIIRVNEPDQVINFVSLNAQTFGADDEIFYGTNQNDSLGDGGGDDRFIGGAGNDSYTVNSAGDIVIESTGEGVDTVLTSISYSLSANVENLTFIGTANINGTGNALNNTILGNVGNNILDGGAGSDRLEGFAGNDVYIVDITGDLVIESASGGTDTVRAAISYTLNANVENLTLTGTANINGTGNALTNAIAGNSGNNTLNGGAGNDTLTGGAGNDTLTGGLGSDRFLFDRGAAFATSGLGVDRIADFVRGTDRIVLDKTTFTALTSAASGALSAGEFAAINAATNGAAIAGASAARIVFNRSNGELFYNPDGRTAGLGTGGLFATLSGITSLAATDFLVQA